MSDPEGKGAYRVLISTPMAESAVAPYLTELAAKVEPRGVKVGSYPRWGKKRNTVTLVGRYVCILLPFFRLWILTIFRDESYLESLVAEVEENVKGKRVRSEDEDDSSGDTDPEA